MTNEIATYTVGVIGFERAERRVLSQVVGMSESHQPSFKPFDKSRGGCPDLIMIDADRPSAIQSWNRFRRANAHRSSFAPIFVGSKLTELPCPDPYVLQRPILPTHVFDVLNQVVREAHGFQRPAALVHASPAPTPPDEGTESGSETSGAAASAAEISALVIDDSLPVRLTMRKVLSPVTTRLDFAESGQRALGMLSAQRYSMIFLDCTLPGEDAYEICGLIKKHALQGDTVVVMLTSNSSPADRVMATLAGFDNYLLKPIQSATLRHMVTELAHPSAAI